MFVRELATSNFISIGSNATIYQVIEKFLMAKQDIACVIEHEKLIGIVSKYSLYRSLLQNENVNTSINESIIEDVVTVNENASAFSAKDLLIAKNIGHAVVMNDQQQVTGVLTKSELIKGLITTTENFASQLQSLVNNLQEAIISVDLNLQITSYNAVAKKFFTTENQQIIGQAIGQFYPKLSSQLRETLQYEKTTVNKIYLDQTTMIATFIPVKEWQQLKGAMVVLKDITELEEIASELESTKTIERTLDSALELAYDGVCITNAEGVITKVNESFLHFLNVEEKDQILGQRIVNVLPTVQALARKNTKSNITGEIVEINGQTALYSQMPIIEKGKYLGMIVKFIFKQLDIWRDLIAHMDKLEEEISYYRGELTKVSYENDPFGFIVSQNDQMEQLKNEAYIASQTFSNILITGESGTGKELFADGIHLASGRPGSFVKVNCGAIPHELLESEFFGYADGAFTGARKGGKPGKFELADGGTIFLDEIGDMPLALQVKLLRVLQEKEFERIGATQTTKIDVRVLAATNKNLLELVQEGTFREDLYYRLHVIQLHIPPLRDRLEDIEPLCQLFIHKLNQKNGRTIKNITEEALDVLRSHHWPGNIRELENTLERAFYFSKSNYIEAQNIQVGPNIVHDSMLIQQRNEPIKETPPTINPLEQSEKAIIIHTLKQMGGNRTETAKRLNISRSTLYYKLKKYDITEVVVFD